MLCLYFRVYRSPDKKQTGTWLPRSTLPFHRYFICALSLHPILNLVVFLQFINKRWKQYRLYAKTFFSKNTKYWKAYSVRVSRKLFSMIDASHYGSNSLQSHSIWRMQLIPPAPDVHAQIRMFMNTHIYSLHTRHARTKPRVWIVRWTNPGSCAMSPAWL